MTWGSGVIAGGLRDLWPFLAGLTVLEGLRLVDKTSVLVRSLWGGSLNLLGPGLRWSAALPFDRAYDLHPELLHFGPTGVFVPLAPEAVGAWRFRFDHHRWFPYEELAPLAARLPATASELPLPDGTKLPLPPEAAGRALVRRIGSLATANAQARQLALAEAARERLDEAALPHRQRQLGRLYPLLRATATAAFAWSVLLVPLVVYKRGAAVALAGPLALGFLIFQVALGALGVVALRQLHRLGLDAPRGSLMGLLAYPPATLRAGTGLFRNLAAGLDPLAVLATDPSREALRPRLRAELRGVEQALAQDGESAEWRAIWTLRQRALEAFLERLGMSRAEALAAPERQDPRASHYCPYCSSEMLSGAEDCRDCLGRVVAFGPATP